MFLYICRCTYMCTCTLNLCVEQDKQGLVLIIAPYVCTFKEYTKGSNYQKTGTLEKTDHFELRYREGNHICSQHGTRGNV